MIEGLADRAPWHVVGLSLGLVVVGVMWTLNQRVGAVGGYTEFVDRMSGRSGSFGWRAWFSVRDHRRQRAVHRPRGPYRDGGRLRLADTDLHR